MSRRNATFWSKVGETGVGEMGVGEQGISPIFHTSPSPSLSLHPPPSFVPLPPSLPTANAQIVSSTLGGRAQFEVKTGQLMGATLYSTGEHFVVSFLCCQTFVLYRNAIMFYE